jgi:hypothetical protein
MLKGLQDVAEETCTPLWIYAIGGISAATEAPAGYAATLPLENYLFVKREVLAACEHFLLLRRLTGCGGKIGQR